jgi:hypothetical protein
MIQKILISIDTNGLLNQVNSATLRFTFSEEPIGFELSDVSLGGSGGAWDGSLSAAQTDAQGRFFHTAVVRPAASTTDAVRASATAVAR